MKSQSFHFQHRKAMTFPNATWYEQIQQFLDLLHAFDTPVRPLAWGSSVSTQGRAPWLANAARYRLSVFDNLWTSELCSFAPRLLSKNLLPFVQPGNKTAGNNSESKSTERMTAWFFSSCCLGVLRQWVTTSTRTEVRLQQSCVAFTINHRAGLLWVSINYSLMLNPQYALSAGNRSWQKQTAQVFLIPKTLT